MPTGTKLTAHPGPQTITKDGAVVDGWDTGTITVSAKNVTIRNTRITATTFWGVHGASGASATLDNVTITGQRGVDCQIGVDGGTVTIEHTDISGCEDGVHLHSDNVLADSYIHDLLKTATSHNDGVQVVSGIAGQAIRHNTIKVAAGKGVGDNSAIFVQQSSGPINGLVIDSNLLDGGGYTLYIEKADNVVASDNLLGPNHTFGSVSTAHGGTPRLQGNFNDGSAYAGH